MSAQHFMEIGIHRLDVKSVVEIFQSGPKWRID